MRPYFTLAVYEAGAWSPQFGDYEGQTVRDELSDYREQGYKAKHLRIVRTAPNHAAIMVAIANLNANEANQ